MKNRYGYGSYHGRGGFRIFLKIVIVILVLALLFLVGGYFFLQQYAVVTDDGIRYDIPFLNRGNPSPSPSQTVVLETPPVIVTTTPTPTPEPTQAPIHAVSLDRAALYDGTAESQITAAGGNAAIFDMKADDGTLGYVSGLQLAKDVKSSDSNPAVNAAIKALTGGELYTIARVSCFKDNTAPYRNNALSIKSNSGYNWKDQAGDRWASPTNEAMRQYVTEICVELAALGFDEIVLDNACYPTQGHLEYIKVGDAYDPAQLSTVVDGFYQQVKTALAGYPDVKLSIRTTEEALDGTDVKSGQTAANVAQTADRVWVAPAVKDITDYTALLADAGMKDLSANLVVTGTAAGAADASWAITTP